MKKITKVLVIMLLALSLMVGVVGCSDKTSIKSVEWGTLPSTEYTLSPGLTEAQSLAKLKFSIKANYNDGADKSVTITEANLTKSDPIIGQIAVSNFSLSTEGTRTATVKVSAFSLNFTYTVTDPNSSSFKGSGKADAPYLISNASQFAQIVLGNNDNMKANYKLTADIDLSKLPSEYMKSLYTLRDGKYPIFSGSIDGGQYTAKGEYTGKNFKLMNFTASADISSSVTEFQPGLFYLLGNCSFKGIDLVNFKIDNASAAGAGFFGVGQYRQDAKYVVDDTAAMTYKFENINVINSYMNTDKNSSAFVGYTYFNITVDVANCTIDKATKLIGKREVGGFVGSTSDGRTAGALPAVAITKNAYNFVNCNNAATLVAAGPGALIGNCHQVASDVKVNGCKFTGSVYRVSAPTGQFATVADAFTSNPWTAMFTVIGTNSSSEGAKFFIMKDATTNNYTKSMETITPTTDTNISIPVVASATRYVISYSFYINQSLLSVAETFVASDAKNGRISTVFVKPVTVYTDAAGTRDKVTTNVATGVIVVPSHFSNIIGVNEPKQKVMYSIVAFDANDIPIASCSGVYSTGFTAVQ